MILRCFRWFIIALFAGAIRGQDAERDTTDNDTAHFGDFDRGRISWVVDDSSLPWIGSYFFIGSSISHSTVLLSVYDSSTGIKLGECTTKSTFSQPNSFTAIPPLMKHDSWEKVVFHLQPDLLQCNISDTEQHVLRFPLGHQPRSFSVRILANRGPRCVRDMIVQNERPSGCPPLLRRNNFSAFEFECGCPDSMPNQWNAQVTTQLHNMATAAAREATSHEQKTTSAVEFPIFQLTTDPDEEEDMEDVFTTTSPMQLATFNSSQTPLATLKIRPITPTLPRSLATFIVTSHPCASYACLNNGTCIVDVHTKPHCICREGFTGDHCETDLCKELACENGGKCQIINGHPVCQCLAGTTGMKCEQIVCEKPCENGGQCILLEGKRICQCLNGFIGKNCNVKDSCANATACAVFGKESRCQLEPGSHDLDPDELTEANYTCECLDDDKAWTNCIDLALARQEDRERVTTTQTIPPSPTSIPAVASTTTSTIASIQEKVDAAETILLIPSSTKPPQTRTIEKEIENEDPEIVVASSNRKKPSNKSRPTIEKSKEKDHDEDEEYQTENNEKPAFPLTGIPETTSDEVSTSESIIEQSTSETPRFSQLPDLSSIFTTEETTSTPTEDYEETDGDNGFEKITQIGPGIDGFRVFQSTTQGAQISTKLTITTRPTTPKSIEIGEPVPGDYNGVEEEFGTTHEEKQTTIRTEEFEVETTTHLNLIVDQASIRIGENTKTNTSRNSGATTLSWIIAISAIVALLLLITGSGLFVLRYIKRSRRLHGKYNPAREENMVASTYSMPMTSVSKEERLI